MDTILTKLGQSVVLRNVGRAYPWKRYHDQNQRRLSYNVTLPKKESEYLFRMFQSASGFYADGTSHSDKANSDLILDNEVST